MPRNTRLVHILESQHKQLEELAHMTKGTPSAWAQHAVANFLADEAKVWVQAAKDVQKKVKKN